MVIMGVDGFDPKLVKRYAARGKLPHISKLLAAGGTFTRLRTSYPPQSPVAWSSIAIGANPGRHGIFDFIHRDPKTLQPEFSVSRVQPPGGLLRFGKWQLALRAPKPINLRQGVSFWQRLCEHQIPSTICAMPANYPPDCPCHSDSLKILSGMGTPDLAGTQGTATFFTTHAHQTNELLAGLEVVRVQLENGRVSTELSGPAHPYLDPSAGVRLTVPLEVTVDGERNVASIEVSGKQLLLNEGEFSPWVQVDFPISRGPGGALLSPVPAMVRFYLKNAGPRFQLYASPLNIDPSRPAVPISQPPEYAKEIADAIGLFYTQNMPPDTKAREHHVFDDAAFLEQIDLVFDEEKHRYLAELQRFEHGLLFHYFGSVDQLSHIFWRAIDRKHPLYNPELGRKYGNVIARYYQQIDELVGRTLAAIDSQTVLLLISDHGFSSFRWGVNLNTILANKGFITLSSSRRGTRDLFKDADWRSTRAYGIGLNGIYINLKDREPQGSVSIADYLKTVEELRKMLLAYVDPQTKQKPFAHVARKTEIYSGPYLDRAPDLIVSYERNYRASWETVLGSLPSEEIVLNHSPWSGDHSIYPPRVPGVLIANRKLARGKPPHLQDIAPTILDYFGIPAKDMEGRPLLTPAPNR